MATTIEHVQDVGVVIVGAGFGGLGAAIRLREEGHRDVVVLEKADDLGGTWRENTYPGCACDVPSHLYSFSFAPNPDWTRFFAPQEEILDYLKRTARDRGIEPLIRFGCELRAATWDEAAQRWVVETTQGTFRARALISAAGPLSEPAVPDLPGLGTFAGPMFHSAQWDHGVELRGKRVVVVGTGASAAQFIPQIQPEVARLTVFQRTPPWVLPRLDWEQPVWLRRLLRRFPALQRALRSLVYYTAESLIYGLTKDQRALVPNERLGRWHLRRHVKDPELRRKLQPSYRIGCKRIIFANDYFPALAQPNVEVVTDGIREVVPDGLVDGTGRHHPADVLILGTGFDVWSPSFYSRITGRSGRTLRDEWEHGGPQAHRGTVVSGFPNHFLLIGPNTGLGNNSMINIIEAQLVYVLDALRALERQGLSSIDVRPEVQQRWNADLQRRMAGTVWTTGGCRSWYLTEDGVNRTLWPTYSDRFKAELRRFDLADFDVVRGVPQPEPAAA